MSNDPRRAGHRSGEWFEYQLLDHSGNLYGSQLKVEPGGRLDWNLSSDVIGSGSIPVTLETTGQFDLFSTLVRVIYHAAGGIEQVLMTGIPAAPDEVFGAGIEVDVQLFDRTLALKDDQVGRTYGVAIGANIIDEVISLIDSVGVLEATIPTSAATLVASMSWPADTSKLVIVNELLKTAGYTSLRADAMGRLTSAPTVLPSTRPVVWEFDNGPHSSIILPRWRRSRDFWSVPNKVICVQATEGDTPANVAVATNTNPDSPFSYSGRGERWITQTFHDVNAASFEILADEAQRRLVSASQVAANFDLEHPLLVQRPDDVVLFTHSKLGPAIRCVTQSLSLSLTTGAPVRGAYQEVIPT